MGWEVLSHVLSMISAQQLCYLYPGSFHQNNSPIGLLYFVSVNSQHGLFLCMFVLNGLTIHNCTPLNYISLHAHSYRLALSFVFISTLQKKLLQFIFLTRRQTTKSLSVTTHFLCPFGKLNIRNYFQFGVTAPLKFRNTTEMRQNLFNTH